jgi:hypothetical protein
VSGLVRVSSGRQELIKTPFLPFVRPTLMTDYGIRHV